MYTSDIHGKLEGVEYEKDPVRGMYMLEKSRRMLILR